MNDHFLSPHDSFGDSRGYCCNVQSEADADQGTRQLELAFRALKADYKFTTQIPRKRHLRFSRVTAQSSLGIHRALVAGPCYDTKIIGCSSPFDAVVPSYLWCHFPRFSYPQPEMIQYRIPELNHLWVLNWVPF